MHIVLITLHLKLLKEKTFYVCISHLEYKQFECNKKSLFVKLKVNIL